MQPNQFLLSIVLTLMLLLVGAVEISIKKIELDNVTRQAQF